MNNNLLIKIMDLSNKNNININNKSTEKIKLECKKTKRIEQKKLSYILSILSKLSTNKNLQNNNYYDEYNKLENKINNIDKIINLINENDYIEYYTNC